MDVALSVGGTVIETHPWPRIGRIFQPAADGTPHNVYAVHANPDKSAPEKWALVPIAT